MAASPTNSTRLSTSSQTACSCPCPCHLWFGLTWRWISSRGHPYTDKIVAKAFFAEIVRLHGIPESLASDCDPVFTSAFWKELLTLSGAKLQMTTAFHPQADG